MSYPVPNAFSRGRFRAIFKLALPIIAGTSSQTLLNLVDTAMVGRLGTNALAAVGLASMLFWLASSMLQGLGPSVQAITARRLGEKNERNLHLGLVNAGYLIVFFSIPYTWLLIEFTPAVFGWVTGDPAVQSIGTDYITIRFYTIGIVGLNYSFSGYFNGLKKSMLYMGTLLSIHPLNILLNYLLIFGAFGFPEMGVRGAALGTAIATSLGSLCFFILMIRHRNPDFSLGVGVLSRGIIKSLLGLAIPNCARTGTMALGFLLFFSIAAMVSKEALAATKVIIDLALIFLLVSAGFGLATITLVGNALGENRPGEARAWVRAVLSITVSFLGLLGLVIALSPKFWLGLFIVDPAVIQMATLPLTVMGLSQSFDAAAMILSYAHLGGGASRRVMLISFVNQWLIFLPLCFVWVYFFNGQLIHLWICMSLYRLLLFFSFLVSIRGTRWLTVSF